MEQPVYVEYDFRVSPLQPGNDILIAELGELGFDSFVENEVGLQAYIPKSLWDEEAVASLYILSQPEFTISFIHREIVPENWNETWEKNFHPITVDGICTVRAPFHEVPTTAYDLIIEPKMSFGTGHHETTHMMLRYLLNMDMEGKKVLDMGCGTAVLAILAEKRGAAAVDAIDIDNWCYLNSLENAERNGCERISVYEGDAALIRPGTGYDVIIANINRNILLTDIPIYTRALAQGGTLLLSGFYEDDIPVIEAKCAESALKLVEKQEMNLWVALKFLN